MMKEQIFKEMSKLRAKNPGFDVMVSQIENEIDLFVKRVNSERSFRPISASQSGISLKVPAVPLNVTEKSYLLCYLEAKYDDVVGPHFTMRKCLLSKKYRIKSLPWNDLGDCY